jgi:hypothetical protein
VVLCREHGYYPGSLFSPRPGATLADHGSWAAFWGEVYSADKASKTTTSIGSGLHAKRGRQWSGPWRFRK